MALNQKAVDGIARTFYSGLALAGCFSSLIFVALGLYGIVSENILKKQLFFAGLAAMGVGVGTRSVRFLKYVRTHPDLPEGEM